MIIDPERHEVAALKPRFPPTPCRVLEIGCGDGRLTRRYSRQVASVIAIDTDEEALAAFRASPPGENVDVRAASALTVALPAASVDVVLFSWSL